MSSRLVLALLALCLVCAPLRAAENKSPAAAADSDVTTYYVGLLAKGLYAGIGMKEERMKTEVAHINYINQLAKAGKLLVSGPFTDNGAWQGIYIFKCTSLAEAQKLAAADPEVQAGRLKIEIHPWQTVKGYVLDPEFPMPK